MPPNSFPPDFHNVAKAVAPGGKPYPAVSLCCFVGEGLTTDTVHLYAKPYFQEWYVISKDDLIYQMKPSKLQENGRSAVWINADAIMVKCEQSTADVLVAQHVRENDDPAGGDGSGRRGKP